MIRLAITYWNYETNPVDDLNVIDFSANNPTHSKAFFKDNWMPDGHFGSQVLQENSAVTITSATGLYSGYFVAGVDSVSSKSNHSFKIEMGYDTGVGTTYHKLKDFTGTQQYKFLWLRLGSPEDAPTYLETLDKLDQRAKAQYVPKDLRQVALF